MTDRERIRGMAEALRGSGYDQDGIAMRPAKHGDWLDVDQVCRLVDDMLALIESQAAEIERLRAATSTRSVTG